MTAMEIIELNWILKPFELKKVKTNAIKFISRQFSSFKFSVHEYFTLFLNTT